MQNNLRVPVGLTAISELMEMQPSEVRFWDKFSDVRNLLKDYNYGVLKKDELISKLYDISISCIKDETYHYSMGIENLIDNIKFSY